MYNDIIKFLNIEDENLIIKKIITAGNIKEIHIEKRIGTEFCPSCHSRMHSKGFYTRTINHPILQDGFQLKLILKQRKWRCTNPQCNLYFNDQFNFVEKHKQSSSITPYMILREMKNINNTSADVAKRYHVSDTTVHYVFLQYLDIRRLPLPEILSIDEVYLNMDYRHKYALILMNFKTGDIIDILPNRWEETTNAYFLSIPLEERRKVRYIVCDMYNPYINYTKRYFPNSIALIDSFHVVSWLNRLITISINDRKRKYQERDRKNYKEQCERKNRIFDESDTSSVPVSREVYLLNNFRWLLLQNEENIEYRTERKYNHKLRMYLNTYDIEKLVFDLDDNFRTIRSLKEKYIEFNHSKERDPEVLNMMLSALITEYSDCQLSMFREFSVILEKHKQEIINSFTYIIDDCGKERRISNGPMEGYNRTPKDFKRNSRGIDNFEYARCRLIWANRKNEKILAMPKSKEEVYRYKRKKR